MNIQINNLFVINTTICIIKYLLWKIYKIIDFGRAIYSHSNKVFCSDSFHAKGDANFNITLSHILMIKNQD